MKKILLLVLIALAGTATAYAQTPNVTQLIDQLQDPDWNVRATAFYALSQVGFASSDQLTLAAIDLLSTENSNNAETAPDPTAVGESYGEYYGDVISIVVQLNDPRSISALVGAINTGGMAMNAIAKFGTAALSQVIQQLSNTDPTKRMSAAFTIGNMITANLVGDSNSQAMIQTALNNALSDPDYYVEVATTTSLQTLVGNTATVQPIPPSQVSTTASGLAYSRVSKTFNGTVTITNISAAAINGPFQVVFTSLTPGVILSDATGTFAGNSYITVPSITSLAPGQSAKANVQFTNPSNATINFTPVIYSGSLN